MLIRESCYLFPSPYLIYISIVKILLKKKKETKIYIFTKRNASVKSYSPHR